ncbi:MAG: hypothetical protein NZM04_00710 [Methylacidiphilales bacterium]|nr:hypothetical protein [Candidatus Methylacidiphilales bacterium]
MNQLKIRINHVSTSITHEYFDGVLNDFLRALCELDVLINGENSHNFSAKVFNNDDGLSIELYENEMADINHRCDSVMNILQENINNKSKYRSSSNCVSRLIIAFLKVIEKIQAITDDYALFYNDIHMQLPSDFTIESNKFTNNDLSEYGSIKGVLKVALEGENHVFYIKPFLYDTNVLCIVHCENYDFLIKNVGKTIYARGKLYIGEFQGKSSPYAIDIIDMGDVEIISENETLSLSDVRGLLSDVSLNVPSEIFVSKLRAEWDNEDEMSSSIY